jgi:hypothetical protein
VRRSLTSSVFFIGTSMASKTLIILGRRIITTDGGTVQSSNGTNYWE